MILRGETLDQSADSYLNTLLEHARECMESAIGLKAGDIPDERLADVFSWLDGRENGCQPVNENEADAALLTGGILDLKRRIDDGVPAGWFVSQLGKVCMLMNGTRATLAERKRWRSESARTANAARHAENREIAERIKGWFHKYGKDYKSLSAAAEAATRIEPVSYRTAYKHIAAAAKEQRDRV